MAQGDFSEPEAAPSATLEENEPPYLANKPSDLVRYLWFAALVGSVAWNQGWGVMAFFALGRFQAYTQNTVWKKKYNVRRVLAAFWGQFLWVTGLIRAALVTAVIQLLVGIDTNILGSFRGWALGRARVVAVCWPRGVDKKDQVWKLVRVNLEATTESVPLNCLAHSMW